MMIFSQVIAGNILFRYILLMLKGISLQLNGISNYLEAQLRQAEPSWDSFHLNTQKNTFEMLKLARIVFTQLQDHLPRDVGQSFDKATSLLRQYFQNRPKGDLDEEKEHWVEYDEVQRFLQNKPQITTNDEERGELFKFLAMNQQKEKNTQMMLQSMPRYSCDFSYHSMPHRNRPSLQNPKHNQALPQIWKGKNANNAPQSKLGQKWNQFQLKLSGTEKEVQTEITIDASKSMTVSLKESCDMATEMESLMQQIDKIKENNENGEMKHDQQMSLSSRKKNKSKGSKQYQNQSIIKQINTIQNNKTQSQQGQAELGKGESSSMATSSKIITRKQQAKPNPKGKKQQKRDSSVSTSSKKDAAKGVTKKASRASREETKQIRGKPAQESRFNKEKENITKYITTTIIETPQQLITTSYQVTPQLKEEINIEANSQSIKQVPDYIEKEKQHQQMQKNVKVYSQIEKTEHLQQNVKEQCQEIENVQNSKKKSAFQREKIISNKEQVTHSEQSIQPFSSTIGYPFYRKASKNEEKAESSLPKIQQRGKARQEHTNLKKKMLESSPYFRQQKQLKNSSSCQLNNRSLHLPAQSHPINEIRYQHTQSLHLGHTQKQEILREQHVKVVRQIESLTALRGQPQLSKVLRSIRHYQLMHASLCGQNCIHLNKFYDFLRRKNLGVWLNRRQLQLHKKNIEIGGNH